MADSPTLYVYEVTHNVIDQATGENFGSSIGMRPATAAEILSAARAHLDIEAALSDLLELAPDAHLFDALRIVDAALGEDSSLIPYQKETR